MARVNKKTNEVMVDCNMSFMEVVMNDYNYFSKNNNMIIFVEYSLDDEDPLIQNWINENIKKWNNGLRGYYNIGEFYDFVCQDKHRDWESYKKIKEYYYQEYKKFISTNGRI